MLIKITFKGCVRYIFTSLFCMSKRELFRKKEKCFLFHFESSFRAKHNQILTFQIFKCHDMVNTKHILLKKVNTWPVYVIL